MKMMGLTDSVYFLSWFIQYLVINSIFSIVNSMILRIVFKSVNTIIIFLILWLYGMCVFAIAYFFQSLMERTRIALIFSILIYFIMYFLSLVVVSDYVSNQLKLLVSLLPPSGLQLGIQVLLEFEVNFS